MKLKMNPIPIDPTDMLSGSSSEDSESTRRKEKQAKKETQEKGLVVEGGHVHVTFNKDLADKHRNYVLLETSDEHVREVVDVFVGREKTCVQLPSKLAHGLESLLFKPIKSKTSSTSDDEEVWDEVFGCQWMVKEDDNSKELSGDGFSHVTKSLSLPDIAVESFIAFTEWAAKKKTALEKSAEAALQSGARRVEISRQDLQAELWAVVASRSGLPESR